MLFILIKLKSEIEGLAIFDYNYLYSEYAADTTFFLQYIISIKHMIGTFYFFLFFSGLTPKLTKCEITSVGALKWVKVAVCGMRCTYLNIVTLKYYVLISLTTKS